VAFVKGKSGNPSGKPKYGLDRAEKYRRAFERAVTPIAITRITKKLIKAAEEGHSWAIQQFFDRVFGKPKQEVEHGGGMRIEAVMLQLAKVQVEIDDEDRTHPVIDAKTAGELSAVRPGVLESLPKDRPPDPVSVEQPAAYLLARDGQAEESWPPGQAEVAQVSPGRH